MAQKQGQGLDFLAVHPFVQATVVDKIKGVMLGGALGDAVGLYTEFLSKKSVLAAYGAEFKISLVEPATIRFGDQHRDKFEEGAWTDDTDHALLVLLSYLHNGSCQPLDVAARLRIWIQQGLLCLNRLPLGVGKTIGGVVTQADFPKTPAQIALKSWIKSNGNSAANGSLMRTHPLGVIALPLSVEETYQLAMEYSLITHSDPRCVLSCCIATSIIRSILRGELLSEEDLDTALEEGFEWVDKKTKTNAWSDIWAKNPASEGLPLNKDWLNIDYNEFKRHVYAKDLASLELDSSAMGYVYKSLGSSVFCLRRAIQTSKTENIFEQQIMTLIMEGGDADTNACTAGAFLGAWVGFSTLPNSWSQGMKHRDWLLQKTESMCKVLGVTTGAYDSSADVETRPDGGRRLLEQSELEKREFDLVERLLTRQNDRRNLALSKEKKGGLSKWLKR